MKKLSVVIVSYNVKYYVEQCIISLQWALRDIDAEIIVVDNHSRDNSPEYFDEKFGDSIRIISSNHNLGFSKANNIAIRQSDSEYVLLLNPDTIVTEESMNQVMQFMDSHPKAGGVGVRMISSQGFNAKESRRGIPTPAVSFYKMIGLCSRFPKSKRFGHYYMSDIPWDEANQIEVMSGAFCMLRRQALNEVGLLDEDYFMYGEDIDLSYRILMGGWENWYVPSLILHYKGESTHKSSFRYVHVFYDAMLIFFRKHFGGMSFIISLPIKVAIYGKAALTLMNMGATSLRDALGLRSRDRLQQPLYVFIGSAFMLEQCRRIANDTALDAEYVEGTVGTLPDGHLGLDLPASRKVIVVYDVHAYQYNHIFNLFAKRPVENISIGTYNSHTRLIITPGEVIQSSRFKEQ